MLLLFINFMKFLFKDKYGVTPNDKIWKQNFQQQQQMMMTIEKRL